MFKKTFHQHPKRILRVVDLREITILEMNIGLGGVGPMPNAPLTDITIRFVTEDDKEHRFILDVEGVQPLIEGLTEQLKRLKEGGE